MRASRPRRVVCARALAARRAAGLLAAGLLAAGLAAGLALAPALPASAAARGTIGGPQLAGHGVIVNYRPPRAGTLPHVDASAYVLADAGTGQVLAAKDPHGWYRPASTLKVLTAITLMRALSPDATVTASHWAANAEPSKVGLHRRRQLPGVRPVQGAADDLRQRRGDALVQATGSYSQGHGDAQRRGTPSAGRRHHGGDTERARTPAASMFPPTTRRCSPGRRWHPEFMQDERLRTSSSRSSRHEARSPCNQNTMLDTFRGDLGGKIGWTTPAKATFIGWARRGHTTLVVTILHCTPLTELTYAASLLDWGFARTGR